MFDSNTVDAVIVATIHFTHPEIAIKVSGRSPCHDREAFRRILQTGFRNEQGGRGKREGIWYNV